MLLNAMDMHSKGYEAKIIIEGEAVKLIKELIESKNPLFSKARDMGLVECVCKACSVKMGVLDYNKESGIRLSDEMLGHPSMASYIADGYQIITL